MKYSKYILPILFSSLFFLSSCQKDIDSFVPDPNQADTSWVASITATMPVSLLKNSLLLPVQTDSFTVSDSSTSFLLPDGLRCTISGNSLVNNSGQAVTGNIYIETMLLKKKGDMVRTDRPTTSNGNILLSGGELLLRLIKDGAEVSLLQQNTLSISYADSVASPLMKLFYGDETNPALFNWLINTDSNFNSVTAVNQTYSIRSNRTGWIAVGTPLQNPGQASVSLTLANQFTNANTMAYLVDRNTLSVIKMNGDAGIRKFTSYGLPFGGNYTVVVISRQGDNYFLGYDSFVSSTSNTTQSISINPAITPLNNITAYLDGL